jgi:hypothetical protein
MNDGPGFVGQVLTCQKKTRSARPGPQVRFFHQSGPHRIPFDVPTDPLEFPPVSHPVVIGLVLPEWQPGSTQDEVGLATAGILHGARDFPQCFVRLQQNMHVVRHDHPCKEFIQSPSFSSRKKCLRDNRGNLSTLQERGTRMGGVQLPVQRQEPLAFRWRVGYKPGISSRKGAMQTPGQEYRDSLRLPMRKSAAIKAHAKAVRRRHETSQMAGQDLPPLWGRS